MRTVILVALFSLAVGFSGCERHSSTDFRVDHDDTLDSSKNYSTDEERKAVQETIESILLVRSGLPSNYEIPTDLPLALFDKQFDELCVLEAILAIEDSLQIRITDEAIEQKIGSENTRDLANHLTMSHLTEIVQSVLEQTL